MPAFPPKLPWAELYVRSGLKTLSDRVRQRPIVRRVRGAVDDLRTTVRKAARQQVPVAAAAAERMLRRVLDEHATGPATIINATGVIAPPSGFTLPLADSAMAAMNAAAAEYSTPASAAEALLTDLTGAEAAIVLHSPAVAALAVMGALGGTVVAARDHVGALDGIPLADWARVAGARLFEIGAIGRVSLDDYRSEIPNDGRGCVWHAQPQSIAIVGDVAGPPLEEVFALARDRHFAVVEYLESSTLVDLSSTLSGVSLPIVGASLLAGADLVIFPGDKFIGGPGCGIVIGRSELVARVAAHPFASASRCDPLRLAALIATLELTVDREHENLIPTRQLLATSADNLRHRAERLSVQLSSCPSISAAEPIPCFGFLDDGRLPTRQIAGWGVAISTIWGPAEAIVRKLRDNSHPLAVSIENGRAVINLRSVLARQDEQIVAAFQGQN